MTALHLITRLVSKRGIGERLVRAIGRRVQFSVIHSGVYFQAVRRSAPPEEAARGRLGVDPETNLVMGLGLFVCRGPVGTVVGAGAALTAGLLLLSPSLLRFAEAKVG